MAGEDTEVSGVAGRYASALFDLARDAGRLDWVAGDLINLTQALATSPDLTRLVRSPAINAEDQGKAMGAILERLKAEPLTRNFVALVARNRRLFVLSDIMASFDRLLKRHRNQVGAEVTSAHPLDDGQLANLKRTLAETTCRDVQLALKVDPSILGGLIVKVGSRMIDSSLKTRLNSLTLAMKEVR
jgi:F-type H+-transporting ATPase subunit delta